MISDFLKRRAPHKPTLTLKSLFGSSLLLLALQTNAIEEIVVSATRLNDNAFAIPYSTTTLSHDQLQQRQARSLPEALAQVPGVMIQKTANGQGSPFIRGFTGYRTLALIDGIRYNNGVYRDGPNEYFSLIDVHSLERIELLNGPSSGLYGSDAIGGALNLHSKASRYLHYNSAQNYQRFHQDYRYASAEGSHVSRSEFEIGEGQSWGLRLGYTLKHFGDVKAADIGAQKNTGYDEDSTDLRLDAQLSEQWRLQALHQNLRQNDVWRTHSTPYAVAFAGTESGSDQRRLKDQNRRLTSLKLIGDKPMAGVDEIRLTLSQQQWREDGERVKDDGGQIVQGFQSTMNGFDLAFSSHTGNIDWRYGLDYYRDRIDSWRSDFDAGSGLERVRIQGPIGDNSRYTQTGIYGQLDWQANQHRILFSSRYGQTRASVGRYQDPTSARAASFRDQWSTLTHALRYSFEFYGMGSQRMIWASISESFRAPNIGDLSRFGKSRSSETEVAATNLDPEHFLTKELGIKWRIGHNSIEASYYHTDIKDFIASTATGNVVGGLTEVSKQNAATGYIHGVEIRLEHRVSEQLEVQANATWLEGELDNNDGEREHYSRIMPPTFNLQLHWRPRGSAAQVQLIYSHVKHADKLSAGDESDLQRIPPGGTPAYNLWHLRSQWQLTKTLKLNIALENLLDEAYRIHGSGSNEPGRNLILGFNYGF